MQRQAFPGIIHLLLFGWPLLFSFSSSSDCRQKHVIVIDSAGIPRSQKEALLILPGFGSKLEGVKDIRERFAHRGYDLFIPAYIGRDSIGQCVEALDKFMQANRLGEYKKVHVFSYIIGSWTINRWLRKHPSNNIATIVYDRSPLQERAPYALVKDLPLATRLLEGRIVEEFARTPYEPIANDSIHIGIIMESRATKLIRKHKRSALLPGEPDWTVAGRGQDYDDYFYTLNNHDEMYHELDEVGLQILYFIGHGKFTDGAPRLRPDIDPFTKKKPAGA